MGIYENYSFVIPAQAGIQSLKNYPRNAGEKPNCMLDKTAGFRPHAFAGAGSAPE